MESLDSGSLGKTQILPIQDRWKMLAIGVGLALISQVAGVINAIKIQGLLDRITQGDSGAAYELIQSQQMNPLLLLTGLIGILAVVFVCMWFYRAGQNVHLAGVKYLNYTPGWYVGWFFIPFVQIVMPFITTIELWKASSSMSERDDDNNWKNNGVSIYVHLWYISFLLMLFVGTYLGFSNFENMRRIAFDPEAALDYFTQANKTVYYQIPLQTISGICLILFSKKITEMHNNYINE